MGVTAWHINKLPDIRLQDFEGPFDLLIELARSHKLDLSTLALAQITSAFLEYIEREEIQPEVRGDFLIVAATLLLLKAQRLLPKLSEAETQEVEALHDRVQMYRLYREQALWLGQHFEESPLLAAAAFAPRDMVGMHAGSSDEAISPQALANVMQAFVTALPKKRLPTGHLRRRGFTLEQCLVLFRERLSRLSQLEFQMAVEKLSPQETALSLLAILELARINHVELKQENHLGSLMVHNRQTL